MKGIQGWLAIAFVGGLTLLAQSAARGQGDSETPPGDIARIVEVFGTKCGECHGPDLVRPKGRFGHVLDLRRLAGEEDYVVPGEPDDSMLYYILVEEDEEARMPPKASKGGPMTEAEIELVRVWIAEGAKLEEPEELESQKGQTSEPVSEETEDPPPTESASLLPGNPPKTPPKESSAEENSTSGPSRDRILAYIGKFHPLVVHFPIALGLVALLAELLWMITSRPTFDQSGRFCLWIAALLAPLSVGVGWLAGEYEGYSGFSLDLHRWFGVGSGSWCLVTLFLGERFRSSKSRWTRGHFRFALLVNAIAVGLTAHFGGALIYGNDHLFW